MAHQVPIDCRAKGRFVTTRRWRGGAYFQLSKPESASTPGWPSGIPTSCGNNSGPHRRHRLGPSSSPAIGILIIASDSLCARVADSYRPFPITPGDGNIVGAMYALTHVHDSSVAPRATPSNNTATIPTPPGGRYSPQWP